MNGWEPGQEVARLVRTMTPERMAWYAIALETTKSDTGRRILTDTNIHTDDEYARAAGLQARIADGMISTNWIQSLLVGAFGDRFLSGGSLRTRYVKPILAGDVVTAVVRVAAVEPDRLRLEVWCENQRGERCTVGEASASLSARG